MGFKEIFINLLIGGLFVFAMIMFGINVGNDNSSTINLQDDTIINRTQLQLNATFPQAFAESNQSYSTIAKSDVSVFELVLTAITTVWKTLLKFPLLIFDIIIALPFQIIFGGGLDSPFGMIYLGIVAIVMGVIVLVVWRLLKTGQ